MKTIIIVVVLTLVTLLGYNFITSSVDAAADSTSTSLSTEESATYTITGEVVRPGTYVLPLGASMYDLLEAASGVGGDADPLSYDTSFVLRPADKSYYIAPIHDNTDTCSSEAIKKCNINAADATTLHEVAGFSNSLANAIVSFRLSNKFQALEMIKDVSGIGPATYLSVRNKITLRSA